jgi:ethanolamine transporter
MPEGEILHMFNELVSQITNGSVFTESVKEWFSSLSINSVIIFIMMIFMIVGAIDKIRGNKLGYGEQFDEGFHAMGALAVAMAGVVAAAPVLAIILKPIIVPIYELFGADPSMFATTLLANDMGGYPLAMQMAENEAIGNFSGLILGSMMGPTIVFTIPVALSIIKKEDRSYLGAGILAGLITIPLGCIAGGLVMNGVTSYKLSLGTILVNLIPVIIIAGLIVLGLWFIPQKMIRGFNKFGIGVTVVITFFTAVAVFEYQTGIKFPLMNLMVEPNADGEIPLESGLLVCGQISIVLIGAFPMVKWITKTFERPLERVGNKLGMNEAGSAGLIASLANNIAMFNIMGDMDPKGKILNVAFAVSAAFVFGDHLGFTAGVNSQMIFPVVVGKLVAGITALILANIMSPMLLAKVKSAKGEE